MHLIFPLLFILLASSVWGMDLNEKLYATQKAALLHTLNIYRNSPKCAAVQQARTALEALEAQRKNLLNANASPSSSSPSSTSSSSYPPARAPATTKLEKNEDEDLSLDSLNLTPEEIAFLHSTADAHTPLRGPDPVSLLGLSAQELRLNGLIGPEDELQKTWAKHGTNVERAAQNFENVVKVDTIDAHAVSTQIKATYKTLFEAAEVFFGNPPPLITAAQITTFLNQNDTLIHQMAFFDLNKKALSPALIKAQFLQGWQEHTGKVSHESGVNVDQMRAITFHGTQQLFQKIGYTNETRNCLERFLTQGSDAKGTCLEGHTNRHYLALLFILQAYIQHIQ